MENIELRVRVSEAGLHYQDIAREMGVSRVWLSTLMRYKLSPQNYERILQAITTLEKKED